MPTNSLRRWWNSRVVTFALDFTGTRRVAKPGVFLWVFPYKSENRGFLTVKTVNSSQNPHPIRHQDPQFCSQNPKNLAKTRVSRDHFSLGQPAKQRLNTVTRYEHFLVIFCCLAHPWLGGDPVQKLSKTRYLLLSDSPELSGWCRF